MSSVLMGADSLTASIQPLAAALARAMRGMLFHVQPGEPVVYLAIVVALALAVVAAAWVPVRRAVRVDPTVTLRAFRRDP